MDIDDMDFAGNAMLPATPLLTAEFEERGNRFPLSWSPEEIHPQTVTVPVKNPEFIFFRVTFKEFSGNRARHYYVSIRFQNHKMVRNNPSNPSVIVGLGPEEFSSVTVFSNHSVSPGER